MFEAEFYRSVLPERVKGECHGRPGQVPVVQLQLATGKVLDLCHIVHVADTWFAVQYFRDAESCEDMDIGFLPYNLVAMVTVSLHHPNSRRMGFQTDPGPARPSDVSGYVELAQEQHGHIQSKIT